MTESVSLPPYKYNTLGENQIRLLYLMPGDYDHSLQCTLKTDSGDDTTPYDALSYCWGKGRRNKELVCDDAILGISENLSNALKRIRYPDKTRILWADQICINQGSEDESSESESNKKSKKEKSSQVRFMGQIFSRAMKVLVWLGEADQETGLAFKVMKDISKQIVEYLMQPKESVSAGIGASVPLLMTPTAEPEWIAYRNLLRRPWFTRVWTFQELALSQEAFIICGHESVSWVLFFSVFEMIATHDKKFPGHESHLIDLSAVGNIIRGMTIGQRLMQTKRRPSKGSDLLHPPGSMELLSLVKYLQKNEATEPSDKIYALLGVADDADRSMPGVDYQVHFRTTYSAFSHWFINRYHDLSVLRLVRATPARTMSKVGCGDLPSWVPDFRRYHHMNNLQADFGPAIPQHGANRQYNATGASKAYVADDDVLQLTLQGVRVGMITTLSDPCGNLDKDVAIGSNVSTGGQWSQLASTCSDEGIYRHTNEHIELAYARLRVVDYLPGELTADDRRRRKRPLEALPEPGPISHSSSRDSLVRAANGDIGIQILNSTTRQRLYITDTGYIGLAHQSCVRGDQVYLLMGGDMPFILRKLSTGSFHFKGESYVHGIMDGEFLLKLRDDSGSSRAEVEDGDWLDTLGDGPVPFQTETVTLA
jgi:hypothetical protein